MVAPLQERWQVQALVRARMAERVHQQRERVGRPSFQPLRQEAQVLPQQRHRPARRVRCHRGQPRGQHLVGVLRAAQVGPVAGQHVRHGDARGAVTCSRRTSVSKAVPVAYPTRRSLESLRLHWKGGAQPAKPPITSSGAVGCFDFVFCFSCEIEGAFQLERPPFPQPPFPPASLVRMSRHRQ